MSGGKVTIGGTNYKIIGGKTTIGGTGYSIPRGRTTIGGTGYKIQLFPLDLLHLLTHADFVYSAGRDASTTGTVSIAASNFLYGAGTYYLFSAAAGFLGIHKLVYDGTKIASHTQLGANAGNSRTFVNIYIDADGKTIHYARGNPPQSATAVYGAGMVVYRFLGYSIAEIDSILNAATATRVVQRSQNTTGTVTTETSNLTGKIVYAYTGEELAFTYVTAYNNYKVLQTSILGRNLLYMTSSTTGISKTGTSNTAVYHGGIGTIA